MHLSSLVCELVIVAATITTLVTRGDGTVSDILFLALSILATIGVAYVNIAGSASILALLMATAQRVRDSFAWRTSAATEASRPRASAAGGSATDVCQQRASAFGSSAVDYNRQRPSAAGGLLGGKSSSNAADLAAVVHS